MRLKNNRDIEREFNVLLKVMKNNNTYLIYQDLNSNKIYSGKVKGKKLVVVNEQEYNYLNTLLERISD